MTDMPSTNLDRERELIPAFVRSDGPNWLVKPDLVPARAADDDLYPALVTQCHAWYGVVPQK